MRVAACILLAACSTFESKDDGADAAASSPASTSCADSHVVCEDFSGAALPPVGWDQSVTAPAAMALSAAESTSAPRSLEITSTGLGGPGNAFLSKVLPATLRKISCSFSLRPERLDSAPTDSALVAGIAFDGNVVSGVNVGFDMMLHDTGPALRVTAAPLDGGVPYQKADQVGVPLVANDWNRVTLTVDLDNRHAELKAGSTTLVSTSYPADLPSHNGGRVSIGAIGVTGEVHYFIDDVVCD